MKVRVVSQDSPRLLDRMRAEIRLRHYSLRTEQAYIDWVRRYIYFHDKRHPQELGAEAVRDFLSHLASERNVSASTQNQAKSALLFLYREILKIELQGAGLARTRSGDWLWRGAVARCAGGEVSQCAAGVGVVSPLDR